MEQGDEESHAGRVKRFAQTLPHRVHSVSEFCHLGYFATAAGLMHEFHTLFAAGCGIALFIVLVFNKSAPVVAAAVEGDVE